MESKNDYGGKNPAFILKSATFLPEKERRFYYGKNKRVICVTDEKGDKDPDLESLLEIRVGTGGFIPLWEKDVTLHWRFNKSFGSFFENPEAAKNGVRSLLQEAISNWKEACPVKFREVKTNWDFEIAMHKEDCDNSGCVLASAFFPGRGQNTFYIYPTMLEQNRQEQVDTIEHEIGHIFGLRHFFADIKEADLRSELFGTDTRFSIMNYGNDSKLRHTDINDLARLYELVWTGKLTEINGTEIRKFLSFHMK